ncbi:DUF2752 domain-containing protein [Anaeromyxobacter diazotrophicus]|uniref:DUF2752 domain-containing protein n=1 Tax=Anaeromyxobacter diazotrophicus TaxID=2590199 RepID=A0A7I9VMB8_9BACT|nr:DUF2752 domain-containing protein [Anaeromyxobacter diazotrophicus]GEJ57544.1 hypothetical protein AMYX_22850 [Anaeromyxobacter diazotrophicus]
MVARRGFGHPEVYAAVFALSFAVARFAPWLVAGLGCPFRALTGVPCATCGMTRAFVRLAHGEVAAAALASPFGALLAAGAWLFAAAAAVRLALGLPWPRVSAGAARRLALLGVLALLANWAFLVVADRP